MYFTSSIVTLALGLSSTALAAPSLGLLDLSGAASSAPVTVPGLDSLPNLPVSGTTSPLSVAGGVVATAGDIGPVQQAYGLLVSARGTLTTKVNALADQCSRASGDASASGAASASGDGLAAGAASTQSGLSNEVVSGLQDISGTLQSTAGSMIGLALPAGLEIAGDIRTVAGDIASAALAIVDLIASTLVNIIFGLGDSARDFAMSELTVALNLVGPLVRPALNFARNVGGQAAGSDNADIMVVLNGALNIVGAPSFDCGCA